MKNNLKSINSFFNSFEMDEDIRSGHYYKGYLTQTIIEFMKQNAQNTAYDVYTTFFDCYRNKVAGNTSFIDLLDHLRAFEENASILLDKQRDHYIHSVNVFILGLVIYAENEVYQNTAKSYFEKDPYQGEFSSAEEEFLFRWGIASLLHDIGYPVEITNNQIKKFMEFAVKSDEGNEMKPFIGFGDFSQLNLLRDSAFEAYTLKTNDGQRIQASNSSDLLSYSIHKQFDLNFQVIKAKMDGFLPLMQENGFVDHGFYSALMVLHWYGQLLVKTGESLDLFYNPIVDAASAIVLHNYYKNTLQKSPFNLGPMNVKNHPIAFLLILCDELQEWNRKAYGILDKHKVLAADCEITVGRDRLEVHYVTFEGTLSDHFAPEKQASFLSLLHIEEVFKDSIHVTNTTKTEQYIARIQKVDSPILPRPFLEQIEKMAMKVHENYNAEQLKRHPDKPLEYPDWKALPDDLKYSNVQQARGYFDKLKLLGYVARVTGKPECEVEGFTHAQIESLARQEHDRWYEERLGNGWAYGETKDTLRKLSPYMVPYDDLSEEIKELDRDAVRNIFPLLNSLGLRVFRESSE